MRDGTVIGECMQRHRNGEFVKFLSKLHRSVDRKLAVHVIVDNYSPHKHENLGKWLAKHPALPLALHADFGFLAELGGAVLPRPDRGSDPARCVPQFGGVEERHYGLSGIPQRTSKDLPVDGEAGGYSGESRKG